ncbi:hypothetical protein CONPUDRAFT_137590 [Coniophora puteana RWD-64-598 SS2]|uniref:ferric-chelate reductase (NADPH) n=1 Tax=Coniophora puteana (strain RWD-64-598) TaxID=741705 RepID=A0A5M3MMB2_CONPW|nr:uncharacterized protein CONPUDRAFT_137590 [Coniophora puteana RWD-64-598 SS2]EIW80352.1 hypothetical protein CONPUDRAFT_137590 [Coniophora puteana RWD-64-598 SS2]
MSEPPSSTAYPVDPTTPPIANDVEWITAYLTIYSLSSPSRRYSFLLWIAVVFVFCVFAVLHWSGSRGGFIGAAWTKWSLRRRTWRKKHNIALARKRNEPHRQPVSLPSNAQLFSLAVLFLASCALAFVGPDYVDPRQKVWQVHRNATSSSLSQRFTALYDTFTIEQYQPNYQIDKAWWTSAARSGQIAYALFPLCVLFALKAPPFAIFAIPFMIQLYFDKLAWLHRWSGRIIWLLTFLHVALWSVQLMLDHKSTNGSIAYVYAWLYEPFILGWTAFGLLTLLIVLSIHPIRRRYYEVFYALHLLLVPSMLVTAALHHPTLWYWCWAALAIWIGERVWRATWWAYINGYVMGLDSRPLKVEPFPLRAQDSCEMQHLNPPLHLRRDSDAQQPGSPVNQYYDPPYKRRSSSDHAPTTGGRPSTATYVQVGHVCSPYSQDFNINHASASYLPPPGYAHAELLAGRTVRLRLVTPGYLPWAPGQHFLVHIPHISNLTSHPFTSASLYDESADSDFGRVIVLLIRAKGGWTLDLFDAVTRMVDQGVVHPPSEHPPMNEEGHPPRGVLLKANVDGPFGSSIRARWGNYSTVLVVVGGSGVSFGLAVLQYICLCLSGRDGKTLGGHPGGWGRKIFVTRRVRFVWLVREYAHIQWGASVIRTCLSMLPPETIQVDIYVTNFEPLPPIPEPSQHWLPQPRIHFAKNSGAEPVPRPKSQRRDSRSRSDSEDSSESHYESAESDVDLSYYTGEYDDDAEPWQTEDPTLAHEENILELTEFDGDHDVVTHVERSLSQRLRQEGKLRRASSRHSLGKSGRKSWASDTDRHASANETQPQPIGSRFRWQQASAVSGASSGSTVRLVSPVARLPELQPLAEAYDSTMEVDLGSPTETLVASEYYPWQKSRGSGLSTPALGSSEAHFQPMALPAESSSPLSRSVFRPLDFEPEAGKPPDNVTLFSPDVIRFPMDKQEAFDLHVVSEHARPGKPKLDRILANEVEQSQGQVIVACCGPTSLNAMVRKVIARQIDPARIWRGDLRGSVALVSEEFEY